MRIVNPLAFLPQVFFSERPLYKASQTVSLQSHRRDLECSMLVYRVNCIINLE